MQNGEQAALTVTLVVSVFALCCRALFLSETIASWMAGYRQVIICVSTGLGGCAGWSALAERVHVLVTRRRHALLHTEPVHLTPSHNGCVLAEPGYQVLSVDGR